MRAIYFFVATVAMAACLSGCAIQEMAYLNTPKEDWVSISGSVGPLPNPYYGVKVNDSVGVGLDVLRHIGLKERAMPGVLLIDLQVTPKKARSFMSFRPELIRVVVLGDTLPFAGSKITCEYPNTCYHRAIFRLDERYEKNVALPPDSVWCRIDLTNVLSYQGKPVEFGSIIGRLPK